MQGKLAPHVEERILLQCKEIYKETGDQNAVFTYLQDIASSEMECPEACDEWVYGFFNANEMDILS